MRFEQIFFLALIEFRRLEVKNLHEVFRTFFATLVTVNNNHFSVDFQSVPHAFAIYVLCRCFTVGAPNETKVKTIKSLFFALVLKPIHALKHFDQLGAVVRSSKKETRKQRNWVHLLHACE